MLGFDFSLDVFGGGGRIATVGCNCRKLKGAEGVAPADTTLTPLELFTHGTS